MQTAHELFMHELSDMLDAERKILEGLGDQIDECSNSDLQNSLEKHREQTEGQISRLEQCFEELSAEPEDSECAGIKGIIQEHDEFKEEEDPSEDILDCFNVTACSKVEHYEICAYESLIRMADMMQHKSVSKLLNQTLKEEQQMLKKLEQLATKIKPEELGMEEMEEEGVESEESSEEVKGKMSAPRRGTASSKTGSRRKRAA